MGPRFSNPSRVIAALIASIVLLAWVTASAQADDARSAAQLYDVGLSAFEKKDYTSAIAALEESYLLSPKPETLFALAQAERLNDNCEGAVVLYRKFLEKNAELRQSQLVRENLTLCEEQLAATASSDGSEGTSAGTASEATSPGAAGPADRRSKTSIVTLSLIVAGAAGLGTSTGLFIAARANRNGADAAGDFEDYERLNDRADTQQTTAVIVGIASLALVAGGTVWALLDDDKPKSTTVSIGPASGRGVIVHLASPF